MSSIAANAGTRVLVTGANGNTGRVVAARLRQLGFDVRGAARSGSDVTFEWTDRETYDAALSGVQRMYLLAPALVPAPEQIMTPFIERALRAGVKRVVLLSSSAIAEGEPGLGLVHAQLRALAPEWTVLRPSWFMQNFVDTRNLHGRTLAEDGVVTTATGEGKVAFVDAADIGEVAARALADEQSHDTAHLITGPEALDYDTIARIYGEVRNRAARHLKVSVEASVANMVKTGIPESYAWLLAGLDGRVSRGEEAQVSDVVEHLTGRRPRSFEAFLRER